MPLIKVILGSTRPNRFGIQPAEWIMQLSKEHPEATFELGPGVASTPNEEASIS